jgi:hypothetical protein
MVSVRWNSLERKSIPVRNVGAADTVVMNVGEVGDGV